MPTKSINGNYNPDTDHYAACESYSTFRKPSSITLVNTNNNYPFGKEHSAEPVQLTSILAEPQAANIWSIADFDGQCGSGSAANPPTYTGLAAGTSKTPVHGTTRNFQFFDGHVGWQKVTTYLDY
jgi:prepilin-type processing-associated H-X9-DG protein